MKKRNTKLCNSYHHFPNFKEEFVSPGGGKVSCAKFGRG